MTRKICFRYFLSARLLIPVLFLAFSCQSTTPEAQEQGNKPAKESLLEVNKKLVKNEDQRIEDFIARYQWDMKATGTGLRFMITKKGYGPRAEKGKLAKISYTVSLLDGSKIYSSEEAGTKTFEIGKGGVESGLEEGILLLNEGDRAKFIIPSHLAFGLLGDQNKIPAKATLVYDLELIKIK